jgi:hypothetical protein
MDQKTFYKFLLELGRSPHKASLYLKDKRLTAAEKRIIEAQLLVRDGKNEEAVTLMKKTPPSEFVYVEGQRRLILGVALNNLSRHQDAEPNLKDAAQVMDFLELDHSRFIAYFNLFILFCNVGDFENMRMHLETLKTIPTHSIDQEIRLLRCQFMYYSELMDLEKAEEYLALLKLKKKEMNENERISLLISKFKFYIRSGDHAKCQDVLDQMKSQRKFKIKENFKYMKVLFEHLINGEPIYAYDQNFIKTPLLHHQIKVIQMLESGNLAKAQKHWEFLEKLNSAVYGENFEYRGSKSLFSVCLEKHRYKIGHTAKKIKFEKKESLVETLIDILKNSIVPIPKDQIYRMLWGEPPQGKEDLGRLVRLVYKVKTEFGVSIQYHRGTYFIGEDSTEKIDKKVS